MSDRAAGVSASADRHVGRRMRERRVQLGLSLAQLACALGVTTQQAAKYESGRNGVPASRLGTLAMALGVEVGWFFDGLAERGTYTPELPTRPRMLLDLVRATGQLEETGLLALCEAARALAAHRSSAN